MEPGSEKKRAAPRFLAEPTLGKLAKWLRLLGFDTRYHAGRGVEQAAMRSGPDRILLTRTESVARRLAGRPVMFIENNDPEKQLRQVVSHLGLTARSLAPFSRCLRCNRPTVPVSRESVRGKVPDYVWETASGFTACDRCRRVYWAGTHTERALGRIRSLFGDTAPE